jgi:hypothetical protein
VAPGVELVDHLLEFVDGDDDGAGVVEADGAMVGRAMAGIVLKAVCREEHKECRAAREVCGVPGEGGAEAHEQRGRLGQDDGGLAERGGREDDALGVGRPVEDRRALWQRATKEPGRI